MPKTVLSIACLMMLFSMPSHAADASRTPAPASAHQYWLSEDLSRLAIWEQRTVSRDADLIRTRDASH